MRTVELNLYQYDELSPEAQAKARDWYREGGLGYDWWDFCYEDFMRIAEILGIEFSTRRGSKEPEIYFTGFYCQGSGSSFVGTYRYAKGALAKIKKYAPQDEELHRIAKALQDVQSRYFYKLVANIESVRDQSTRVSVEHADDPYRDIGDAEVEITELMKDFNDWMFRHLEREYEWLTSDEVVEDNVRASEYEFDEDGNLA